MKKPTTECLQGTPPAELSGLRKAAVFLLSLEESAATELLRLFGDREVQVLLDEIADVGVIDRDTVEGVLREFRVEADLQRTLRDGSDGHAVQFVEQTPPSERTRQLSRALESPSRANQPLAFLSSADTDSLVALFDGEGDQTVAVVLAHMQPQKAWQVLEHLPVDRRRGLVQRIATLEPTPVEILRRLEKGLRRFIDPVDTSTESSPRSGLEAAADILQASGGGAEDLLGSLEKELPELSRVVSGRLKVFDDIARLDDEHLGRMAREIELDKWAIALKTATPKLKERVLRALPDKEAQRLRAEIDRPAAVKLADIDQTRRAILERALGLSGSEALEAAVQESSSGASESAHAARTAPESRTVEEVSDATA